MVSVSTKYKISQTIEIDPILDDIEIELILRDKKLQEIEYELCRRDRLRMFRRWIWIENMQGQFQRLYLNTTQKKYWHEQTSFDDILKARKQGISTFIDMDYFCDCIFEPGTKALLITDKAENSEVLFKRLTFAYERLPNFIKPIKKYSSRRELEFIRTPQGIPLNTNFAIATAGSDEIRRGTDIDRLHLSEYAFYKDIDNIKTGPLQALRQNAKVRKESTANGFNHFEQEWRDAVSGNSKYKAHFFPWYIDSNRQVKVSNEANIELTPEEHEIKNTYNLSIPQIMWRRENKKELGRKFEQEFPANDVECFVMGGGCIFDTDVLKSMILKTQCIQPIEVRENGLIKIWKAPEPDKEYVSGWDTSEGDPFGDPAGLIIMERETCECVADIYGQITPQRLATLGHQLCQEYNETLEGVERNNHGHVVIDNLLNKHYSESLYYHQSYDDKFNRQVRKPGWLTDGKSKPIMFDDLVDAINHGHIIIHNPQIIKHLMSCIWGNSNTIKQGNSTSHHADYAIMLAIAWQMRKSPISIGIKII